MDNTFKKGQTVFVVSRMGGRFKEEPQNQEILSCGKDKIRLTSIGVLEYTNLGYYLHSNRYDIYRSDAEYLKYKELEAKKKRILEQIENMSLDEIDKIEI